VGKSRTGRVPSGPAIQHDARGENRRRALILLSVFGAAAGLSGQAHGVITLGDAVDFGIVAGPNTHSMQFSNSI